MRKKTIMLCLLCLFTVLPMGATARTMTYSLSFANSDFQMQRVYNYDTTAATYIVKSSRYQLYTTNDPTQPELPVIYVTLLLPKDASYAGFSYEKSNRLFKNYLLTVGSKPVAIGSQNDRSTNGWYPYGTYDSSIEFAGTTTVSGYRMVTFKVMPIRYIYSRYSKNSYVSSFILTIDLNDADTIPLRTSMRGKRERSYVNNKIWNKDCLSSYFEETNSSTTLPSPGEIEPFYRDRYIIITNNELKTAFQPLLKWKELKGLEANIVTVEEIDTMASLAVDTGIQKIKHYLKHEYENNPVAKNIEFYVLLGGDANIIPPAYCAPPDPTSQTEYIPCDMYYACVSDTLSWNWINNEDGTLLSWHMKFKDFNDLFVSRASVRTPEQVSVFVNKVIQYETNPPSNWGDKMLFLGENIFDKYNYVIPRDDEIMGKYIIENTLDSIRQLDADFLFSSASNIYTDTLYMFQYNNRRTFVDSIRFSTAFQGNYAFVNEISHGEHSFWEYNISPISIYSNSQAMSAVSAFPKIVCTMSCLTNSFDLYNENDNNPSLSESLMRNPNSGVVGYVGSSRFGWVDSTQFLWEDCIHWSYKLNYYFTNGLYSSETGDTIDSKNLGQVVAYVKSFYNQVYPIDRYLIFSTNTLGDPEMPIYTERPKTFENVNCIFDGDSLAVFTNDSSTYEVVLHVYDGIIDEAWYKSVTPFITKVAGIDSFDVVLLKQNYIPQIIRYYSSKYIQNATLTETDSSDGEYQCIYIGRNVTTRKPIGNVAVVSGKTVSLKAKREVYIKNGFTSPLGSTFEIDIAQPNNNP